MPALRCRWPGQCAEPPSKTPPAVTAGQERNGQAVGPRCRTDPANHADRHRAGRLGAVGRLVAAQQHARRQKHSRGVERRQIRPQDRRVAERQGQEHQMGRPARLAVVRQSGDRQRPRLCRQQQRRRLSEALSRSDIDLGVLLCFNEADGKFLWQHSNEKLPTGRVHDWPMQGVAPRRWSRANGCGT